MPVFYLLVITIIVINCYYYYWFKSVFFIKQLPFNQIAIFREKIKKPHIFKFCPKIFGTKKGVMKLRNNLVNILCQSLAQRQSIKFAEN